MTLEESTAVGSSSLPSGSTSRPEGEKVLRHGSSNGEEASLGALANSVANGHHSCASPSERMEGGGLLPRAVDQHRKREKLTTKHRSEGETEGAKRSSEESDLTEPYDIVRATTKFAIDLTSMSAELNATKKRGEKRLLSLKEKEARDMLEDVSRLATLARNVGIRTLFRTDTDLLDAYISEHGELPKKANEVLAKQCYSYNVMRKAAPRLSSNVQATLQRNVDAAWKRWRFDVLIKQVRTAPHYRLGQPVPIPKSSVKVHIENDTAYVTAALYSEQHQGPRRFTLPVRARDAHQKTILENLASGEWRHGEVQIERDRLRPQNWYLKFTYKKQVLPAKGNVVAAINRGMKCFIVSVIQGGETWIYDGNDIEAYLKQIQRRRRSYQEQVRASARVGHGRTRALVPIDDLIGKAERWRKSRCQVIARRLAQWLAARGVTMVLLEDFAGIRDGLPEKLQYGGKYVWQRIQEWPYYQLGQRLTSCLEELGIQVKTKETRFYSQKCPSCGHTSEENIDLKFWRLRCKNCRWNRHLDVAFCLNALASDQDTKEPERNGSEDFRGDPKGQTGGARKPPGKAS